MTTDKKVTGELLLQELEAQHKETDEWMKKVEKDIEEMTKRSADASVLPSSTMQMDLLKVEKDKLRYRLEFLKKRVEEEANFKPTYLKNVAEMLSSFFTLAVEKSYPEELEDSFTSVPITQSTNPKFGDYQCNAALPIASKLKVSPRVVAEKILQQVPDNTGVIEKLEIAGHGFINIHLSTKFVCTELSNILVNGVNLLKPMKKRVLVDFSSPNVAKEMHVGHLRSTIIGDTVCRLLEYFGHDVLRLNHVGDWGTQFGMLIAHLRDKFPDYLKTKDFSLPISDLQSFYKESKKRFDEDEEFKKRAYSCVVELQALKPEFIQAWNLICDISRKEFTSIYNRLGVVITERGESFYQSRMLDIVQELEGKGFLENDEGRKIMFAPGVTYPLTIVKSDGGFTYDTSDMACIKQRIEEERADWIIYITDAGQATHFDSIYKCAERAGILDRKKVRIDHIGFGVVLGDDKKKFKTRSGDTVRLADLLDEGIKRAGDKLREKGRDEEMTNEEFAEAEKAVAYGCIKYADLAHNLNHEYVFSFDKMLDDKGNTAVYLLYAYTRIKSIARKAGVSEPELIEYAKTHALDFKHEKEIKLSKKLLKLPEILERITKELLLHPLCELMFEIATVFTEFYDSCYCIEKDKEGNIIKIHMERLILCEATAAVLKKGFDLLGISPVSKM